MAEVTNELIYEVLKALQKDVSDLKLGQSELKTELNAIRGHMIAMQQDIHSIYSRAYSLDDRIARIERRLNLVSEPG